MRWTVLGACAALWMATAACGGEAAGAGAMVRDSAGIRIVQNDAPAWKEGQGWTVSDTPAVDIGVAEGEAAYQFSRVAGAVRLSDGRIAVADGRAGELRYFSADGRHLRSAGRRGGGPGEFQEMHWLGVGAGDSVLVWDAEAARLSVFSPDGAFVRAWKPDGLRTFPRVRAMVGGRALLMEPGMDPSRMSQRQGEFRDTATWLHVPLAGGAPRQLSRRPDAEMFGSGGNDIFMTDHVVFGRSLQVAGAADGYYAGDTDAFQVGFHGPDGALLRLIRRPNEPRRVTDADLNAYFAQDARMDLSGMPPEMAARFREMQRTLRERVPHRRTLPAFSELLVDGTGNLWVRDPRPDADQPHRWSVFDGEGRWLGTVQTPADLRVRQIGADWVLGTALDELDVEHVRVHRIRKPR
jgi:hypothetical protein